MRFQFRDPVFRTRTDNIDDRARSTRAPDLRVSRLAPALFVLTTLSCGGSDSPPTSPATTGSVAGRITEYKTGSGVPDASVILVDPASIATRSPLAHTDATGQYRIEDIPPGIYAMFVQHDSMVVFDWTSGAITVRAGQTTTQNLHLQSSQLWSASPPRIAGVVRDALTGVPVAGAYVSESAWGVSGVEIPALFAGIPVTTVVTDSQGRFSFSPTVATDEQGNLLGLSPISVTHSGYEPFTLVGDCPSPPPSGGVRLGPLLPIPTGGDSTLTVEVRLQPLLNGSGPHGTGALSGRVVFVGTAVAGVRVGLTLFETSDPDTFRSARQATPVPDRTVVTDADGLFVVAGLAPGRYSVVPGFLPGDDYVPLCWLYRDVMTYEVTRGDTIQAGDIEVGRAVLPLAPAEGSTVTDRTPRFSWTALAAGDGYEVAGYVIWYSTGYVEEQRFQTVNTCLDLADSLAFAPGTKVRWVVDALIRTDARPDTLVRAGTFDKSATFTVL